MALFQSGGVCAGDFRAQKRGVWAGLKSAFEPFLPQTFARAAFEEARARLSFPPILAESGEVPEEYLGLKSAACFFPHTYKKTRKKNSTACCCFAVHSGALLPARKPTNKRKTIGGAGARGRAFIPARCFHYANSPTNEKKHGKKRQAVLAPGHALFIPARCFHY